MTHPPIQGRARTEGWVQSARPVGAVRALPGQRDRAKRIEHAEQVAYD